MGHWHDISKEIGPQAKALKERIPDTWDGFVAMHRGAMAEGELSKATKELIALAISVVDECDGCIAAHARGAARHGATEQQVAEALGVAVLMAGGPATIWGPRAFSAFLEFAAGN